MKFTLDGKTIVSQSILQLMSLQLVLAKVFQQCRKEARAMEFSFAKPHPFAFKFPNCRNTVTKCIEVATDGMTEEGRTMRTQLRVYSASVVDNATSV